MNKKLFAALVLATVFYAVSANAADNSPKPKNYDGIITQMNAGDGSFVMRLRDGSFVTVKNPMVATLFLSVKGVLDPLTKVIDKVTTYNIKDALSPDAIPFISSIDPGAGQWGAKLSIFGTGFTKKNSISIGGYNNAIIGVPAKNGKLTFSLPSKLCDRKLKTNCGVVKMSLSPGDYNVTISNENGVSNSISFTVNQSPPLAVTNEDFPQVMAKERYSAVLSGVGGLEDYVWKIAYGSLPPGLSLTQAVCPESPCRAIGAIVGTPTTPGVYPFTVSLTSGAEYATKQFTITIVQPISSPNYTI